MIIPTIVFGLAMYSHVGLLRSVAFAGIIAVQLFALAVVVDFIKRRINSRL